MGDHCHRLCETAERRARQDEMRDDRRDDRRDERRKRKIFFNAPTFLLTEIVLEPKINSVSKQS